MIRKSGNRFSEKIMLKVKLVSRRRVTMPVYTVHAPVNSGADLSATDKFAFVRDGFHFWAAVFSPVWLAWHRLWLALVGWIAVTAAVDIGLMGLCPPRRADAPAPRSVCVRARG